MTTLTGIRVLLVEDEPIVAMGIADQLVEAGAIIVGPFRTVRTAIKALQAIQIDVAVVDFVLADGESEPVQDALEQKGVPFVVLTAYPPRHSASKPGPTGPFQAGESRAPLCNSAILARSTLKLHLLHWRRRNNLSQISAGTPPNSRAFAVQVPLGTSSPDNPAPRGVLWTAPLLDARSLSLRMSPSSLWMSLKG